MNHESGANTPHPPLKAVVDKQDLSRKIMNGLVAYQGCQQAFLIIFAASMPLPASEYLRTSQCSLMNGSEHAAPPLLPPCLHHAAMFSLHDIKLQDGRMSSTAPCGQIKVLGLFIKPHRYKQQGACLLSIECSTVVPPRHNKPDKLAVQYAAAVILNLQSLMRLGGHDGRGQGSSLLDVIQQLQGLAVHAAAGAV
ncbi:hypothetical protein GALMADRAFT_143060 [Galerina marginata CBS 339.88]|uniref:Uncharacterized protein n=1 Tax=Galerina marginata (strain CBS 339.88) TaxID=685588 RepID=A0A067SML6_GALM3|nr:hypothetical protein GALMADRAFT_143060 [Galerina marginata CBS 339.88]